MNKLLIPIMVISIFTAIYEQNKEDKNPYILIVAFVVFMICMMKLMSKIPSKNQENNTDNDS